MNNSLNELTILRFTQAFESGGGIETYLNDLDDVLLHRNKATIIRLYLDRNENNLNPSEKRIGLGLLIKKPLKYSMKEQQAGSQRTKTNKVNKGSIKNCFINYIIYNSFLYHYIFHKLLSTIYPKTIGPKIVDLRENVTELMEKYKIDIVVLHYLGNKNVSIVIDEARRHHIPYVFVNHFSNDCFNNIAIREQTVGMRCIAGVTDYKVPRALKGNFTNVSDGIDLQKYSKSDLGQPSNEHTEIPVIFYPGRITRNKGQLDLLKAFVMMKNDGIRAKVVFAGRTDCLDYEKEIRRFSTYHSISNEIDFIGQIGFNDLKHWYSISTVLAFPTYHPEGLPRIVMEAQSMGLPVVAYGSGGVPAVIQHGKTGFLVKQGNVKELKKFLVEVIVNKKLREEIKVYSTEYAKINYSLESLAVRHEELYKKVMQSVI